MHTEPDVTRIVRSWLRTDEHESADRVLDDVLVLLDTTPQRRSWWPARRYVHMNNIAKVAIAAAAVVVVAVVGINLLPGSGGVGGSGPSASPSATTSPTASPTPRPSLSPTPIAAFPPKGELAVGSRHRVGGRVPYSLSVPTSGWLSNGEWGLDKSAGIGADGAGFILWPDESPVGVYADPCGSVAGPALGTSAAKLADAVAKVPGTDLVSGPTDVTVGGHPAKHVVLTIREDIGCTPNQFYLWYGPSDGNARYATEKGSTIRVWIVDVDGKIVWIDGETYKGAGPEPGQEIQQIVDSIRFE